MATKVESSIELQSLPSASALPSASTSRRQSTADLVQETLVSDLAPVDRGRDAWLFVLSALLLETFVWGFSFTYGVFQNYYVSSPSSPFQGSSISAVSAIGTTNLAVPYISGLFIPSLMAGNPRYIKPVLWTALAAGTLSFVLSSFANAIWQLIILQGVLVGLCSGLIYTPVLLWLGEWFVARRGLASGIILSGIGIGGAIFPPLIGLLLDRVGFRWTLRIWALIFATFAGIAIFFMKPRLPIAAVSERRRTSFDFSYLKDPLFIVVSTTVFLQSLAFFPVNLYMPTYTSLLGLPPLDGQLVLSVFNAFSVVGQILIGWMCDRFPYSRVMAFSAVGSALTAYLLWGFANSLGLIFTFVVLFGTLAGGFPSVYSMAASDIAGPTSGRFGTIYGSVGVSKGFAAIIGPIIAATLIDTSKAGQISKFGGHGFSKVTLFVGGMMMATAAFSVLSGVTSHIRKRHAAQAGS